MFSGKTWKEENEKTNHPFLLSGMTLTIQELEKEDSRDYSLYVKYFINSGLYLCYRVPC